MIVWLASYPRSGNTLLRTILFHFHGRQSTSVYDDESRRLRTQDPRLRQHAVPRDQPVEALAESDELFFVKTHDMPTSDSRRAIYVVRDGRDALVSYAWYVLQVHEYARPEEVSSRRFEETLGRLIDDAASPFGTWSTHVAAWRTRPDVEMVRFEDLVRDPACVERALAAVEVDLPANPDAALPSFESLRRLRPRVFRRGQIGSWRDEFPPVLLPTFEDAHGEMLRELGYDSTYGDGTVRGRGSRG